MSIPIIGSQSNYRQYAIIRNDRLREVDDARVGKICPHKGPHGAGSAPGKSATNAVIPGAKSAQKIDERAPLLCPESR